MHQVLHVALAICLLGALSQQASAQRTLSADVEVKSVNGGTVTTTHKQVCCHASGRLVSRFIYPKAYYSVETPSGEGRIYIPQSNEVYVDHNGAMSSRDNLMYIFLSRGIFDMGLTQFGYVLKSTDTDEEGYVKKTFRADGSAAGKAPVVEVVYKDYLPVYMAHLSSDGKVRGKQYFSKYQPAGRLQFPTRTTEILYMSPGDSVVVRTIYSNLKADSADELSAFDIPSNARIVTMSPLKKKK